MSLLLVMILRTASVGSTFDRPGKNIEVIPGEPEVANATSLAAVGLNSTGIANE